MDKTHPMMVSVDPNGRGAWEVAHPDADRRVTCQTLEDAKKVAHQAAGRGSCELIVHDAYHRVIERETIGGGGSSPSAA